MSIGQNIAARRVSLNMNAAELGRRAGLSRATISLLESGGIKEPSFSSIRRIAKALMTSTDALAGDGDGVAAGDPAGVGVRDIVFTGVSPTLTADISALVAQITRGQLDAADLQVLRDVARRMADLRAAAAGGATSPYEMDADQEGSTG